MCHLKRSLNNFLHRFWSVECMSPKAFGCKIPIRAYHPNFTVSDEIRRQFQSNNLCSTCFFLFLLLQIKINEPKGYKRFVYTRKKYGFPTKYFHTFCDFRFFLLSFLPLALSHCLNQIYSLAQQFELHFRCATFISSMSL